MKKFRTVAAVAVLCALLLSSCVVSEKISLTDGLGEIHGGHSQTDVSVSEYFIDIMEGLLNWTDAEKGSTVQQAAITEFVEKVNESQAGSVVKVVEAGKNTYVIDFSFEDFDIMTRSLLSDAGKDQTLVSISKENNRTCVRIHIDINNYPQIAKIVPFLSNPEVVVFGPLYNQDLSEEEYMEMVALILGDDAPQEIRNSYVTIRFAVPSAIASHNGKLIKDNTVEFSIPLIDLLLLHEPIDFEFAY